MTKYRVVPYDHRMYFVQRKEWLFWSYIGSIFYQTHNGKRIFYSKKEAEDFILSAVDREHFEDQEKKDRKEFKKLNPPYDFP